MWLLLDRFGGVLLDATLATTVMMSVVVLALLLSRQPVRRITIARPAIALASLMIPLAAFSPLPRFHPLAWLPGFTDQMSGSAPLWWQGPWPIRILCLAYLSVVAVGLVWLVLGIWGVSRLIRRSEGPQARTRAFYEEVLRQCGLPRDAAELRVSRRIRRPVLVSLIRPYIVIPPEFEEPRVDPESLRWALVHELAHARERDSRLMAAASLAQVLWFFLPFLHWLRNQLRLDQEFLADQRAVAIAGSSALYATRLVSLARLGRQGASEPVLKPAAGTDGGGREGSLLSPLLQRVAVLLRAPYELETSAPRGWSIGVSCLVVVLGVACSCLSLSLPAAGEAADYVSPATESAARRFRVDRFLAAPRGNHGGGRSLPHVLPLPLPPRFELSVEIQVPREGLHQMRLAGILLDQTASVGTDQQERLPVTASTADWHRVRLRRATDRIDLIVDDRSSTLDPGTAPFTEWLTIEPPPDQPAVLRNLILIW